MVGDPGKTRTYSYINNSSRWILGLVNSETLSHPTGAPVSNWAINRTFDANGNLLVENKYGVETTYTYSPEGDITSITDANNNTITLSDYVRGTPTEENHPEGVTITRTVNASGTVATETSGRDRKSTRLNSSHVAISYAVFCLKKKK